MEIGMSVPISILINIVLVLNVPALCLNVGSVDGILPRVTKNNLALSSGDVG
jgi:hypothetical protein